MGYIHPKLLCLNLHSYHSLIIDNVFNLLIINFLRIDFALNYWEYKLFRIKKGHCDLYFFPKGYLPKIQCEIKPETDIVNLTKVAFI